MAVGLRNGDVTLKEFNELSRDLCQQMADSRGSAGKACDKAGILVTPKPFIPAVNANGTQVVPPRFSANGKPTDSNFLTKWLYGADKNGGGGQLRAGSEGAINAALGGLFARLQKAQENYRINHRCDPSKPGDGQGFGVQLGVGMELGIPGVFGFAGQTSVGVGMFNDGKRGSSFGIFVAGGATIDKNAVIGGSIGGTAGTFATNARTADDLKGDGLTDTISLGKGLLGYASQTTSGNVRYGTAGVGLGEGFSASSYTTTTASATLPILSNPCR